MMNNIFLFGVLLLVNCVFGVEADEVSVSVMEGDSVTLHTDVTEVPKDSKIIWKFGDEIIAKMNEADEVSVSVMVGDSVNLHTDVTEVPRHSKIIWKFGDEIIAKMNEADATPSMLECPGAIFKDRLKLDKQTGSLTITNIRTEHIGRYSVDIRSTDAKLKTFQVTVHVGVKTVSVMERDPVNLDTGVLEIKGYDLIQWKTGGNIVAEVNKSTNLFGPKELEDLRFSGRLHLKQDTGDLTIRDSKTSDTGDYHLHMSNSAYTLERTIRVTVETRPQSGAPSGIYGAGVGLVVWVVTVFFAARFVDNKIKGVSVKIK